VLKLFVTVMGNKIMFQLSHKQHLIVLIESTDFQVSAGKGIFARNDENNCYCGNENY